MTKRDKLNMISTAYFDLFSDRKWRPSGAHIQIWLDEYLKRIKK